MWSGLFSWVRKAGPSGEFDDPTSTIQPPLTPVPDPLERAADERFVRADELGRGGSAAVFRAFDRNLRREVAMKLFVPVGTGSSPAVADAFVKEARVTARLDHPSVLPIHDVGIDSAGRTYFIMRLVEGVTLDERVRAGAGDRSTDEHIQELLLALLKVCDAVAYAHSRGLIHRDLKPQNVMLGSFGEVYVLDWGLARPKPDGPPEAPSEVEIAGTPAYMAPEQARGDLAAIDERTDVFGVGGLLYFILTGRAPFEAPSARHALALAREGRFEDPQVLAGGVIAPALYDLVLRALARDPAARFASVAELRHALEGFIRGGLGASVKHFAAGAPIVHEGEVGDAAYIITRGRCRAFRTVGGERRVLREMGPGDVFGEMAVILSSPRTASVEAIDDVTVQVLSRADLEKGVAFHPWLKHILRTLTERFLEADSRAHHPERDKPA